MKIFSDESLKEPRDGLPIINIQKDQFISVANATHVCSAIKKSLLTIPILFTPHMINLPKDYLSMTNIKKKYTFTSDLQMQKKLIKIHPKNSD